MDVYDNAGPLDAIGDVMLNDARTLLMNIPGPREENIDIPGDVYIPTYTPAELSAALESVRTVLFGNDADYEGQVYRMAQYMAVLHSTDYREYLFTADARITYDSLASDVMESTSFDTAVVTTSDQVLTVTGEFETSAIAGRVNTVWLIRGLGGNVLSVSNTADGLTGLQEAYVGVPLTLPGFGLTFEISGASIVSGDVWQVTNKERPTPDLSTVTATLKSMTLAMRTALFGDVSAGLVEPYLTFYNLMTQHYAIPYQLSGILLALIERTRETNSGSTDS